MSGPSQLLLTKRGIEEREAWASLSPLLFSLCHQRKVNFFGEPISFSDNSVLSVPILPQSQRKSLQIV